MSANPVLAATEAMLSPMLAKASELREAIADVDKELNVEATGKTRVLDAAADEVASQFNTVAEQVLDVVNSEHGNTRVGIIALLRRVLREFDTEVKAYVDSNTPENSGPTVPVEVTLAKRAERKEMVDAYDALRRVVLNMSGGETSPLASQVPEIKNLRGAVGGTGVRGKRLKGSYSFTVDGVAIAGNKLGDVQKATGATGAKDVRLAIETSNPGFKFEEAPGRFEFQVNGKNVVATSNDSDADSDDEDDDNGSTTSNEDIFGSDSDD